MSQRIWGLLALVTSCALLGACTDAAVREVKDTVIPKSDFSYGEFLDKPKGCKSTKWSSSEDANGRAVVEYTCTTEWTQATLDAAIAKNTEYAQAWRAKADGEWQYSWKHMERHQRQLEENAQREAAGLQRRLEQTEVELQKEMQMLEVVKAKTPESYMGNPRYGMNEYLMREGESRKQSDLVRTEARINQLNGILEKVRHELSQSGSADGVKNYLGQTTEDYARGMQAMENMKGDYFRAADNVHEKLLQRVRSHEAAEQKRDVKLRIVFNVPKRSAVQLSSAQWEVDGQPAMDLGIFGLAIALAKPGFFTETIEKYWSSQMVASGLDQEGNKLFKYRCGPASVECQLLQPDS